MKLYYPLFKHVLEPVFEKCVKRREILQKRKLLTETASWSLPKLQEFQWGELKNLLNHAATEVPYWRDVFREQGWSPSDYNSIEDMQRLPIMTKEIINLQGERCIADNYRGKTWAKATGGSTGLPLQFHYTPESYDWRVATTKRGYGWANCFDGQKQLHIWGITLGERSKGAQAKENLHRMILRQRYLNCFDWGQEAMKKALHELASFQPETIVGYANPVFQLARFCKRRGIVPFSPKAIITGAEKLHRFQQDLITEVFRCPVFNTYGCREFMLMASECAEHDGFHIHMENILLEVVRPDGTPASPGESGAILITDLHNYGMPFIRYQIGDLGVLSDKVCPCGRAHPLLEDVVGRSMEMLYAADGRMISGVFFPHMFKDFSAIRQFQVIQKAKDKLLIKFVLKQGTTDFGQTLIEQEIKKAMGFDMQCQFEIVDEIPLTQAGKYRMTISEIPQEETFH